MTIKTKASIQSYFQRGDRPTSAQFADFINSSLFIPVAGSTVSTGLIEVRTTASTTTHTLGTFANSFLGINTTAQAQAFMAFTSASGAGGGAFGTDWLNAAVTSDGAGLLGTYIASNVLLSAGDTLYTDGSGLQRLTAGTSSYVYTYNSANATPQWSAPRPTLVSAGGDAASSKTTIDFTVPTTAKKIVVQFNGLSTNGTSLIIVQLGISGGIESSGYLGSASVISSTVTTASYTTGFGISGTNAATIVTHGGMTLTLQDSITNRWVAQSVTARSDGPATGVGSGSKSLSGKITTVRVTTVNGTDAFDAGTVNVLYE